MGHHRTTAVGPPLESGDGVVAQAVVRGGTWFGSFVARGGPHGFALVGCTVAPGFDFADFELADRAALLAEFPDAADIIRGLT